MKGKTLWGINVIGPDDIYAMPSAESAIREALIFNNTWCANWRDDQVLMWANVIPWPYSEALHADSLKREPQPWPTLTP